MRPPCTSSVHCFALIAICIVIVLCSSMPATAQDPLWTYDCQAEVADVALSDDGSTVVTAADKIVILTGAGEKVWAGGGGSDVAISSDGTTIAAASDFQLILLDTRGGKLGSAEDRIGILGLAMTPDGSRVALIDAGGFDVLGSDGHPIGNSTSAVSSVVSISLKGDMVVTGRRGVVQAYSATGRSRWTYETLGMVNDVAIVESNSSVAVADENTLVFLSSGGKVLWTNRTDGQITAIAVTPNGQYIAVGSQDNTISLFDSKGLLLWEYPTGHWVDCIAISADGSAVVAGALDSKIYLLDGKGKLRWDYKTGGWVRGIGITRNGALIAAGSYDGKVYYFSSTTYIAPAPTTTVTEAGTTVTTPPATQPTTQRTTPPAARPTSPLPTTPPESPAPGAAATIGVIGATAILAGRTLRRP